MKYKIGDKVIRTKLINLNFREVPLLEIGDKFIEDSIKNKTILTINKITTLGFKEAYFVESFPNCYIFAEELKLVKITNWRERLK